jgi:hypothetical protein
LFPTLILISSSRKVCSTHPAPRPGLGVISIVLTVLPKSAMSMVEMLTSVRSSDTASMGALADTVIGPSSM